MDDLTERFHGLDEIDVPDIWPVATTRSPSGPNGPSLGHRLAVIGFAAVIAVAASGFLFLAFRPTLGTDQPVGGSNQLPGGPSQITIEQLADQDPTATWSYGDAIREGIPVAVVGPGPEPEGGDTPSPRPGSISELLEVTGFSLDSSALNAVSPEPLALPSDEIIDAVGVEGVVLIAFTGEGAEEWGKMISLPTPTDLRLLDVGARYRIVVVGLEPGDSLFQFAFDIDVLIPERDLVDMPDVAGMQIGEAIQQLEELGLAVKTISIQDDSQLGVPGADDVIAQEPAAGSEVAVGTEVLLTVTAMPHSMPAPGESRVPTAEEIVAGEWPLGTELADLLGLSLRPRFDGDCSYFTEVRESGSGYCLEPLEQFIRHGDRDIDLFVISEALRDERVTPEELLIARDALAEETGGSA